MKNHPTVNRNRVEDIDWSLGSEVLQGGGGVGKLEHNTAMQAESFQTKSKYNVSP